MKTEQKRTFRVDIETDQDSKYPFSPIKKGSEDPLTNMSSNNLSAGQPLNKYTFNNEFSFIYI